MADRSAELELLAEADQRARAYTAGIGHRPVFPTAQAIARLAHFDEPLPQHGTTAHSTLQLLDVHGTPGTVEVSGGRYFGFVTGATLPVAAAADRMVLAWDNGALGHISSPTAAAIEKVAGRWLLEILDLPRDSAVAVAGALDGPGDLGVLEIGHPTSGPPGRGIWTARTLPPSSTSMQG